MLNRAAVLLVLTGCGGATGIAPGPHFGSGEIRTALASGVFGQVVVSDATDGGQTLSFPELYCVGISLSPSGEVGDMEGCAVPAQGLCLQLWTSPGRLTESGGRLSLSASGYVSGGPCCTSSGNCEPQGAYPPATLSFAER